MNIIKKNMILFRKRPTYFFMVYVLPDGKRLQEALQVCCRLGDRDGSGRRVWSMGFQYPHLLDVTQRKR